jgi:hypothetical protein
MVYQTIVVRDVANGDTEVSVLMFDPNDLDNPISSAAVSGVANAALVLDPATGTAYQLVDTDEGTTLIGIDAQNNSGTLPFTGKAVGNVVIDPSTATAYLTTYDSATDTATVLAIDPDGSVTAIPVAGEPVGGVSLDPVTGAVFQTTDGGVFAVVDPGGAAATASL